MRGLAICPAWPPQPTADALQASAWVRHVAQVRDVDVVTAPDATTVPQAWARIGEFARGSWPYDLVCSGPGEGVSHLVAATQKLLHPEVMWVAHVSRPLTEPELPAELADHILHRATEAGLTVEPGALLVGLLRELADEITCASEMLRTHLAPQLSSQDLALWPGNPWPALTPHSTDPILLLDTESGDGAALLDRVRQIAPGHTLPVQVPVLSWPEAGTREGMQRALGADVVAILDPRRGADPAAGLVAPYPLATLLAADHPPELWLITRDGSDLDTRPCRYKSPINHPTAALVVLDRLRERSDPG